MVFIVDTRAEMHDTEWLQCSLFLRNPDLPFLSRRSEVFNDQGSIGFGITMFPIAVKVCGHNETSETSETNETNATCPHMYCSA